MVEIPAFSRRSFLIAGAALGGGLAIGIRPAGGIAVAGALEGSPEITPWLVIRPDDIVVIRIARSEMGQGSLTGLAQLVAEELECDWSNVRWEYPTPGTNAARNGIWGDMYTAGSSSIRGSHEMLRKAGAAARMMLVHAAADGWNVSAAECTVDKGVISHELWNRKTTYGAVASVASRLDIPKNVPLKDANDFKLIGKPLKRLDTFDKVTGRQVYGADLRLPGLLNAAIRGCPVFGGKVKSVDPVAAERMPGVKRIVRVGASAVAVVADTWWHANTALEAVRIEWDAGEHASASSATIEAMLEQGLNAERASGYIDVGESRAAIAAAAKRVVAVYDYPFQAHACMEPMNATALYTGERCDVWCGTQEPEAALTAASTAAGLPLAQCDIHRLHLGGGFGRRQYNEHVTQAVLIAKAMPGTPVKLLWSREEDMTQGHYHPVTKARLTAGLTSAGRLAGLHIRLSAPSLLASIAPSALEDGKDWTTFMGYLPLRTSKNFTFKYAVPSLKIDHAMRNTHVPPGAWRGVSINQNAVLLECFIDEIAHAAGSDPLAFRRQLLAEQTQALAVLDAVAQEGGWGTAAARGRHRGLAQFYSYGSYVAAVAEISTDADKVKVHRIVLGIDPGHAVNPAQIERQIAGSVAWGLSALFLQECTIRDGRVEQNNFDTYDVLRMAQMPKVESLIMPSGGFWSGVGEPPVGVVAPAVLNAYFAATGRRIRSIPLKKHGIKLV